MTSTPLGYALIGLVMAAPQTGYALRKLFETSPLGGYSSSPGSIYPALAKLVKNEFIEKRSSGAGEKPLYHVTKRGRDVLREWLSKPVTLDEVAKDVDHALLRFAFLQSFPEHSLSLNFLRSFETAVREHLHGLNAYMQSENAQALSIHGRLAMENGISGYQSHLAWANRAIQEISE